MDDSDACARAASRASATFWGRRHQPCSSSSFGSSSSNDGSFSSFGSFGTGLGQFQRPSGIIWREGLLYVADAVNNRIQVFREDGEFLHVFGDVKLQLPYDLDYDGIGAFYAIEWGAGRVTKLDLEGRLLGRFGKPGSGTRDLRTPWGISWHDGRVLVADTGNRRILELTFE